MNKNMHIESLAYKYPMIAKEWHPTKNGKLTPEDVSAFSEKKVWWYLPYDDPKTGKHFNFEWQTEVRSRTSGNNCPFLSGKKVWAGFNDLATLRPDIAKEWHPTKNKELTPQMVTIGSSKKVWWYLPYDDPKTGKHFNFEWQADIKSRTTGVSCPYLSGKKIWVGFNDLGTLKPDIAKEWHPTKNGTLTPQDVTVCSGKKVWWYLPYDDPETEKHFDFEWKTSIAARSLGDECPYLSNNKVWAGFNDLGTLKPDIAKEWHPTKNGTLTPQDVTVCSGKKVWWYLPYDDPKMGKHFDFEWDASVIDRTKGNGCPYLSSQKAWEGFNDLATLKPDIAKEWHPTKNGTLTPREVTAFSTKKVWWYLPYDDPKTGKHFDFEWKAVVKSRSNGVGCPYLTNHKVWAGFNDLQTLAPYLLVEWDYSKNLRIKPENVTLNSEKKAWWKCDKCGKSWREPIVARGLGREHICK